MDKISPPQFNKKLETILLGMSKEEQALLAKQIQSTDHTKVNKHTHHFRQRRCKIGIISDSHIGSKYFNEGLFEKSLKVFNKEKVDGIYHCGDIIEGMSNRDGHIYELDEIGTSAQIGRAEDLLAQYEQPLFFITGNHDEWAKNKANQGFKVGETLDALLDNAEHLGEMRASVNLAPGVTMNLTHEGNSAYALSYSGQKRINSMEESQKPDIIANGHLHKAMYMNYRGIQYIEAGALQAQTPFMRMKGSPAMEGFWIFDIKYTKKGIQGFSPTFYMKD